MTRWDAVVVGAGPAGSATALRLARAGAVVLLLDRARFPRHKPCSEYLSPETVRLLGDLDATALADVEARAPARLYGMRIVAPDGAEAVGRFSSDHRWPTPLPYGLALPRADLDFILRQAAQRAGATVGEGVAVEDLLYEAGAVGGVMVRETENPKGLPDGRGKRKTIRARIVIGADGLRSVVARRLGGLRHGWPRRIAFTAHVAGVAGVGEMGEMHVGRHGYVGLGPVGGGVTTVALVVPASAARPGQGTSWRDRFLPALEAFPKLAGRFDGAELVREVLAVGPLAQWSRRSIPAGGCSGDHFWRRSRAVAPAARPVRDRRHRRHHPPQRRRARGDDGELDRVRFARAAPAARVDRSAQRDAWRPAVRAALRRERARRRPGGDLAPLR